MNDRAYKDGGVYDDGEPYGTEPMVPPGQVPTCPRCGLTGDATRINHPNGAYFCSCGQLYTGTDHEWRRLARTRRETIERRAGKNPPVKPQKKTIPLLGEK